MKMKYAIPGLAAAALVVMGGAMAPAASAATPPAPAVSHSAEPAGWFPGAEPDGWFPGGTASVAV
ncbi:hypothetical protein [Streptomyces sp. NPDC002526]